MSQSHRKLVQPFPAHQPETTIEGTVTVVGFAELGGGDVSRTEVISELSQLPLDGVLVVLSGCTLENLHDGPDFPSPRRQGAWLNLALSDDFPRPIPRASSMYVPNRVPITGGRH